MATENPDLARFDPSGPGLHNGHFIGLPFTRETARVVILSVPWEVTVSYQAGTAGGPENVLRASTQLDLEDPDVPEAWKTGLYLRPSGEELLKLNAENRPLAEQYIGYLEQGAHPTTNAELREMATRLNLACGNLQIAVKEYCKELLDEKKLVGILGGEHSVPLGLIEILAERHPEFGILQIDAHMDLREAYEGLEFSHASVMFNAMQLPQVRSLVQVGIRDWCEEEMKFAEADERVHVFFDHEIRREQFAGQTFQAQVEKMIRALPEKVYVSFDIDGLDPKYCPHTGTPVPGGLEFQEALYLIRQVVHSGRRIIGFDLCEVAGEGEWDGNVGSRVLYRLANLAGKSNGF